METLLSGKPKFERGFGYVDLGLSVKWATCNIGAFVPEEFGRYFAWGDVVGQTWDGSKWSGGGFSTAPAYEVDVNNNLKPKYDAAHVILGGSWRMPTYDECRELILECTHTWIRYYNETFIAGVIFTGKKAGYTDKSIFLPAAGYGINSRLLTASSYRHTLINGHYWSSALSDNLFASYLGFPSDYVYTGEDSRRRGYSVRPVKE